MALHTTRYPDSPPGRLHVDPTKTALHRNECLEILQQHIDGLAATAEVFGSLLGCRYDLENHLFDDMRISRFSDDGSRKGLIRRATINLDAMIWKSIYANTLPFEYDLTLAIIRENGRVFHQNGCFSIFETLYDANQVLENRNGNKKVIPITIDNIIDLQSAISNHYQLILDIAAITVFETITDSDRYFCSDKTFKMYKPEDKAIFSGNRFFYHTSTYLRTRLPDFIETVFRLLDGEHCIMSENGEISRLLQKQSKDPDGNPWVTDWFEIGKTLTVDRKYFSVSTKGYKTTPDKFIFKFTNDGKRITNKMMNTFIEYHEKYKDDNK